MKQANMRTITSLVAAVIIVIALAFGSSLSGTDSPTQPSTSSSVTTLTSASQGDSTYKFRTSKQRKEHFEKHGIAMGFADAKAYEAAASAVAVNPQALHKLEQEDGDDVYYLQKTDEIVFVSRDGYIRTYFNPGGIDYFNRQ